MKEIVEKQNTKKEYSVPQMKIVGLKALTNLLGESTPEGGDIECEGSGCP